MNKGQLRKKYLEKRKALKPDEADLLSLKICDRFMLLPGIADQKVFHIYLPITKNGEVNTLHIIKKLQRLGRTLVVPRMIPGKAEMETCLLKPGEALSANQYGVPEPLSCKSLSVEDIDVVVLPLLSYDQKGHRIGYGKGYYDRFLPKLKTSAMKVGLSFFDPEPGLLPADRWDIPMQCCVTPERTIWF